jgi:class III poly(R)-hydroxyalkanoic acid synthase PhaE subunit
MTPLEYMQALSELWGRGSKNFVTAQQGMFVDMAERMAKAAGSDGAPNLALPQMADTQGLAVANEAFSKLWSSALELSKTVSANVQKGAPADPVVIAMLGKIFDPRAWFSGADDMDDALQRMAHGPQLADMWDVERKMLTVFNAWTALRRRSLEHNTVMLDAWLQAAGRFAKELNERAEKGEVLESWRALLALWVDTANEALLETQRSEPYLKTQREVLKASTDLRLAQHDVAEFYSEVFGYPTRAELDDVHKSVTELRRELRAMKRGARRANGQAHEARASAQAPRKARAKKRRSSAPSSAQR